MRPNLTKNECTLGCQVVYGMVTNFFFPSGCKIGNALFIKIANSEAFCFALALGMPGLTMTVLNVFTLCMLLE